MCLALGTDPLSLVVLFYRVTVIVVVAAMLSSFYKSLFLLMFQRERLFGSLYLGALLSKRVCWGQRYRFWSFRTSILFVY